MQELKTFKTIINGFKHVLALSAHTDDAEYGAGGTIARLIKEGCFVRMIAFSWCENRALIDEFAKSCKTLGVQSYQVFDQERRKFQRDRQNILDILINEKKKEDFDLILVPSRFDTHQDHKVIAPEAFRAFREASIWGYELSHNIMLAHNLCYVTLTRENVQMKISAIRCYESQAWRPYFTNDIVSNLAQLRGAQVSAKYAEVFEVIKQVV
ncbi:PIG-L deacetylase family protein [Candidatus Hodarchaeum mangrovi]